MTQDNLVSIGQDLGLTKRAYRHAESGAIYETLEIPMPVVQKLGFKRIADLLDVHERRLARWKRNAEILRELEGGVVPKRVAHKHGLSVPQVYRIHAVGTVDGKTMGALSRRLNPKEG